MPSQRDSPVANADQSTAADRDSSFTAVISNGRAALLQLSFRHRRSAAKPCNRPGACMQPRGCITAREVHQDIPCCRGSRWGMHDITAASCSHPEELLTKNFHHSPGIASRLVRPQVVH